jgi:hypothetical protein
MVDSDDWNSGALTLSVASYSSGGVDGFSATSVAPLLNVDSTLPAVSPTGIGAAGAGNLVTVGQLAALQSPPVTVTLTGSSYSSIGSTLLSSILSGTLTLGIATSDATNAAVDAALSDPLLLSND